MSAPTRIGPYTIEREIGRGGMGVVYLGRDPRLGREVAVKMLPEAFAHDPERVQRFEREARLLASLSHPNIAGIHGLEEQEGHRYLVLEYVPGPTLAERLAQGPLPVDDVADIGRQIAAALEAAHESGVIHRDLKPGNVKITPAGEVKVLDFGLAKGVTAGSGVSASDLSQSPTVAVTATGSGVILGTAAYMSPEQARAKPLDRRTDIWSFGCVLYECLTGRRVFEGETASDLIALILQGSPDWSALPADTPPRLRALIERCLEKDAKKRLRDIGEARLALEAPHEPISGVSASQSLRASDPGRRGALWPILALTFAAISVALAVLLVMRRGPQPEVARLTVLPPPGMNLTREPADAALSPDGRTLAFVGGLPGEPPGLWIRSLDDPSPRRLDGGEGGSRPAWSPDSRSIVFAAERKLMRVDLRGGSPRALADVSGTGRGASWSPRGVIVFAPGGEGPLFAVDENGGPARQVTTLDSTETAHRFPEFLPDGEHFLYVTLPGRDGAYDVVVGSIDGKMREHLLACDGTPRYADPGWLVYTRGGRVLAQRFDARKRKVDSRVRTLMDEPIGGQATGGSRVLVSRRGAIAYQSGSLPNTQLAVLDRAGRRIRTIDPPAARYTPIRVSPDERRLAVVKTTAAGEEELWVLDLDRAGLRRLPPAGSQYSEPVWSPDGTQIAYSTMIEGRWEVVVQSASGGEPRVLRTPDATFKYANSWAPDGRYLLGEVLSPQNSWDIWEFPVDSGEARPYVATSAGERYAAIAPNGRWVGYTSNESGRFEAYVQAYPRPGPRYLISSAGAIRCYWSGNGRRLLLRTGTGASIVDLDFSDGVRPVRREGLFSTPLTEDVQRLVAADVSADLERVYASIETGVTGSNPFTVVLNWRSALEPE